MKKLLKIFKFILFSEKQWLKPKKVDILFYDYSMSDIIKDKLSNYKYDILYLRGEKLNIYIIIKLILSFQYKNLFLSYCKLYIQFSHPKIIITAIDNNINFYKLHYKIKSIKFKTIVIQNGYRTCTHPDILNYYENFDQKNLSADFFLCFNEAIGKIYSEKFGVKYIPIGSFLNNVNFNFQTTKKKFVFFWLSQYRSRNIEKIIDEENLTFNQLKNFQNLSLEEYYLPEKTRLEYSNPNYWLSLKQTNQRTFKKHFNNLRKLNQIHSKGIYLQTQEAIANMLDRIIQDK